MMNVKLEKEEMIREHEQKKVAIRGAGAGGEAAMKVFEHHFLQKKKQKIIAKRQYLFVTGQKGDG